MKRVDLVDNILISLHIPKTAGNSIRPVIARQFRHDQCYVVDDFADKRQASIDTFRRLPDDRKRQIRSISGHVYFGLHRWIRKRPVYVSFLREPIDRTVSHYYFMRVFPFEPFKRKLEKKMQRTWEEEEVLKFLRFVESRFETLEDYIDLCIDLNSLNLQARMIGGYIDPDHIIPPYAPMPEDAVRTALANIEAYFPVVGLMERFDESLLLFRHAFGWKNIYYTRRNINKHRPKLEEVPKATRNRIAQHCSQDLELYEAAVKRFEAQVVEIGERFQRELSRFRSNAKLYALTRQVYRKVGLQRLRSMLQRR